MWLWKVAAVPEPLRSGTTLRHWNTTVWPPPTSRADRSATYRENNTEAGHVQLRLRSSGCSWAEPGSLPGVMEDSCRILSRPQKVVARMRRSAPRLRWNKLQNLNLEIFGWEKLQKITDNPTKSFLIGLFVGTRTLEVWTSNGPEVLFLDSWILTRFQEGLQRATRRHGSETNHFLSKLFIENNP